MASCKNLTYPGERALLRILPNALIRRAEGSCFHRNVIHVRCSAFHIYGGSDAGERLEVVNEVGLVIVTAVQRQLRPMDIAEGMRRANDSLKPTDAAETFRRQADFIAEYCDKPALAESCLFYYL